MLGENIYKLRKLKELSQEELAEVIGVSRQTISNWELGETSPNPEQLKLLSKVLGVSVDELINNEIKGILEEKVSNTERLAGIIIKILKIMGILFLVMLIIDVVVFLIFMFNKETMVSEKVDEVSISCYKGEQEYLITIGSDGYFNCSNCSLKIQKDLKEVVDYRDVFNNYDIVLEYFEDNNGTCE